jgi:release factor glutamine methyltransferase
VVERLWAAGCVAPEDEANALVGAAPDAASLEEWICRRERGEPLAWIVGGTRFCGRWLRVDPGVYVPRPQSEELALRATALLSPRGGRAVDLCTGAGAIAVHLMLEVPETTVIGVEIDARAADCARRNGVPTLIGDLDTPLRASSFDVVTAIAPYVPTDGLRLLPADVRRYEPRSALDGGEDGLRVVRMAVAAAARLLLPGGWFLTEVGGAQDRALSPVLADAGFESAESWFDQDGDLRGLVARKADPGS